MDRLRGELTPSLFTVQLLAVLTGFLFDSFVAHVLVETALSSHDCAFFLYFFFFFSFQWEFSSFLLLCFSYQVSHYCELLGWFSFTRCAHTAYI